MSIREFYNDITSKSKNVRNNELNSLYKKPMHESHEDTPITQVFTPNTYFEADLLFMPEDSKFRYILVVVDCHDRKIDAEPLKNKDNSIIIDAFKKIFKRKILQPPENIMFDSGSEFKGTVKPYLESIGVNVLYALVGRHRRLAMVERANQKIGTILFKRMTSEELLTGQTVKQWVDDLRLLVTVLNEHRPPPTMKEISIDPIASKYSGNMLDIGDKVRYQLDYPINTTDNKRLSGKFRSTDIRWSPKIYKITQALLKPGFPPMYLIDKDNVARTKQQLSVITGNQKPPNIKYVRTDSEYHIIDSIVDKKRGDNNKDLYKVHWKGKSIQNDSWIAGTELNRTKELRQMKRDFRN